MATYTRASAWTNGGTFANTDLLWYARGVGVLQGRALDDESSWWFFAAIHGEYVGESGFPGWGSIPPLPNVPDAPVPTQPVQDEYWNQCQHQSWYFPPWHRGYLIALEAQVRAAIVDLGGPSTWALPYWDYLAPGQDRIPPAFTQTQLPDGSPNPLFVAARYGPNNDGNIFVPIPPVSGACMANDLYTGSDANTPPPGFGGPSTGFSHSGSTSGNLEQNPHNLVHVYVGGSSPDGQTWGLMSDPGLAALDPIFYLHHANIDRLWAVWNGANANPTQSSWLNGPASLGQRAFVMPMPGGTSWTYTPNDVKSLGQLNYTYDALQGPAPVVVLANRLQRLGATAAAARVGQKAAVDTSKPAELLGASQGPLAITGSGAATSVRLDPGVRARVSSSLAAAADTAAPDRVFLNLENVRGTRDAFVLSAFVNDRPAGSVGLFGLRRASLADGRQAGTGLSFVLEITDVIDALHLGNGLDVDALDVRLVPHQTVPEQSAITVGRVSVYRQGQ